MIRLTPKHLNLIRSLAGKPEFLRVRGLLKEFYTKYGNATDNWLNSNFGDFANGRYETVEKSYNNLFKNKNLSTTAISREEIDKLRQKPSESLTNTEKALLRAEDIGVKMSEAKDILDNAKPEEIEASRAKLKKINQLIRDAQEQIKIYREQSVRLAEKRKHTTQGDALNRLTNAEIEIKNNVDRLFNEIANYRREITPLDRAVATYDKNRAIYEKSLEGLTRKQGRIDGKEIGSLLDEERKRTYQIDNAEAPSRFKDWAEIYIRSAASSAGVNLESQASELFDTAFKASNNNFTDFRNLFKQSVQAKIDEIKKPQEEELKPEIADNKNEGSTEEPRSKEAKEQSESSTVNRNITVNTDGLITDGYKEELSKSISEMIGSGFSDKQINSYLSKIKNRMIANENKAKEYFAATAPEKLKEKYGTKSANASGFIDNYASRLTADVSAYKTPEIAIDERRAIVDHIEKIIMEDIVAVAPSGNDLVTKAYKNQYENKKRELVNSNASSDAVKQVLTSLYNAMKDNEQKAQDYLSKTNLDNIIKQYGKNNQSFIAIINSYKDKLSSKLPDYDSPEAAVNDRSETIKTIINQLRENQNEPKNSNKLA